MIFKPRPGTYIIPFLIRPCLNVKIINKSEDAVLLIIFNNNNELNLGYSVYS
jgi:hypothetical protein